MSSNKKRYSILISENDPDSQFLYKVAIAEINPDIEINVVFAGEQVLQYLLKDKLARELNRQIVPNLILATYNETFFSESALSNIRAYERFYSIPIYVFRSDLTEQKRDAMRIAGANDVFVKPETFHDLKEQLSKLILSHAPKKLTKGLFCCRCEEVMEFDPEWGPLAGQIKLSEPEHAFIKERFSGALCIPCLRQLQTSYKIISGKFGTGVNSIIGKN